MINCKFEDDGKALLRHVCVGAIVVNNREEVLLVKRAPDILNGGKFAIPGGFLKRDETTAEGALRELKEETGYDGEIVALFQIVDTPNRPKEDRQNLDFRYIIKVVGGTEKTDEETAGIKWFPLDNLPREEDRAFDHLETIELYKEYLKHPFKLPIMNWKNEKQS